ncbi:ABC transporter A, ABCA [Parasponia andersonii]|uniref:ABC transporter A, ABCA n=1 Tax=Parasponia andersonii TaxID=3476 RepID=A0A2P5A3P1_PARAD|nr:ABC transporter A, ABCA [Parasponia andersonii]
MWVGTLTLDQGSWCAIPKPLEWPPLLQVPAPEYRAVTSDVIPFSDLPDESCKRTGSCPVTLLFTGNNQSLGEILAGNMLTGSVILNSSTFPDSLADIVAGSESKPQYSNFLDPAFYSDLPIYNVQSQSQCTQNSTFSADVPILSFVRKQG